MVPVHKEPALRLIYRMMQEDALKRPTRLEDPWMKNGTSNTPKHDRSLSNSSSERPLKRVIQTAFDNSTATSEASTLIIRNAIWPQEDSIYSSSSQVISGVSVASSNVEMEDRSSVDGDQLLRNYLQGDRSFTHNDAILETIPDAFFGESSSMRDVARALFADLQSEELNLDSGSSQVINESVLNETILEPIPQATSGESLLMQDVARRLLAAQSEGYGNDVQVADHSTTVRVVREELSQLSIVDLELDNEGEAQSPTGRSIRSQSASLTDGNVTAAAGDDSRPISPLHSQIRLSSFLDQPFFRASWSSSRSKGVVP